jgi:hypothetical protein
MRSWLDGIFIKGPRTTSSTPVRTPCIPVEIRTEHIPKWCVQFYRYANPLSFYSAVLMFSDARCYLRHFQWDEFCRLKGSPQLTPVLWSCVVFMRRDNDNVRVTSTESSYARLVFLIFFKCEI